MVLNARLLQTGCSIWRACWAFLSLVALSHQWYKLCYLGFFVCLFVCLGFIVPLENCSPIWRRHHCRWRAANFDLCSTLMAIEQWGFFSVQHLLVISEDPLHSHLLTRAVTTCLYDSGMSRLGCEHPTFRLRDQRSNPLHHRCRCYLGRWSFVHLQYLYWRFAVCHVCSHLFS